MHSYLEREWILFLRFVWSAVHVFLTYHPFKNTRVGISFSTKVHSHHLFNISVNWGHRLQAIIQLSQNLHGSYRSPNFLFKEFSKTFPGLLNNIQGVRFFRHSLTIFIILHILHSHVNKPIPISANNVKPNSNSYMYPCVQRITPSAFPAWNLIFCLGNLTVREHWWKQLRSVLGRVEWIVTCNKFQCPQYFNFKHLILCHMSLQRRLRSHRSFIILRR